MSAILAQHSDDEDVTSAVGPAAAAAAAAAEAQDERRAALDTEAAAEAAQEQADELRDRQELFAGANPHEYVTMGSLMRGGPFISVLMTVPIVLSLLVALVVDSPRSCPDKDEPLDMNLDVDDEDKSRLLSSSSSESEVATIGKAPPLKAWAIVFIILNIVMFLVNTLATRLYLKDPSIVFVISSTQNQQHNQQHQQHAYDFVCGGTNRISENNRLWSTTILTSRLLDLGWVAWFITGATWTIKMSSHPCVCSAHPFFRTTKRNPPAQQHSHRCVT